MSATFTNLANMVPLRRDEGVLKRWRGTPLPTWMYLGGFICSAVIIAVVGVVVMLALGVVAYDLDIERRQDAGGGRHVPRSACASFAALGMALAAVVKSASSASAAANAIILPLAFVSNVFIQLDDPPRWLEIVGRHLPAQAVRRSRSRRASTRRSSSPAFDWEAMAFVALWGLAGLAIALKRFRWEPSGSAPRGRRAKRVATT